MKTFLYPMALLFTGIFAQDINSLPECERTCLQSMLTEGPNYGCPNINNGSPAPDCLCSKPEFAYGVRDCSMQSCPSGTDVNQVYQYGLQYCQSAQASASGTALTAIALFSAGASSGQAGSSSETMSSSSSREPITTIPVISTVTSDGSTMETTLSSSTIYAGETISSAGGANETSSANQTAVTTKPLVSTVSESSTTRQTTVGSTTEFSSSSSAAAGATVAAPRLVPGLSGHPTDQSLVWLGRALACTSLVIIAGQLAWAYGG